MENLHPNSLSAGQKFFAPPAAAATGGMPLGFQPAGQPMTDSANGQAYAGQRPQFFSHPAGRPPFVHSYPDSCSGAPESTALSTTPLTATPAHTSSRGEFDNNKSSSLSSSHFCNERQQQLTATASSVLNYIPERQRPLSTSAIPHSTANDSHQQRTTGSVYREGATATTTTLMTTAPAKAIGRGGLAGGAYSFVDRCHDDDNDENESRYHQHHHHYRAAIRCLSGRNLGRARGQCLYAKDIPMKTKSENGEFLDTPTWVKVEAIGGDGRLPAKLRIELTREGEPCFLFSLDVGEAEFGVLRSEQRLLVEFQSFAAKFIELLEQCQAKPDDPSRPRLSCIFIPQPRQQQPKYQNHHHLGHHHHHHQANTLHHHQRHTPRYQVDGLPYNSNASASLSMGMQHQQIQSPVDERLSTGDASSSASAQSYPTGSRVASCVDCARRAAMLTEGRLNLIEFNNFKEITHLSLLMRQSDDDAVKGHISWKLLNATETVEHLRRAVENLEEVRKVKEERIAKLTEAARIAEAERAQQAEAATEARKRETERLTQNHEEKVSMLKQQMSQTEDSLRQLRAELSAEQQKTNHEMELSRNLKEKVTSLTAETEKTKKTVSALDLEKANLAAQLADTQRRLETALAEGQSFTSQLAKESVAAETATSHKREVLAHAKDLESKLTAAAKEILRGNEIITKQRTELKSLRSKAKEMGEAEVALKKAQADLSDFEVAKRSLASLSSEVTELRTTVGRKDKVIENLNQQLTEKELGNLLARLPQHSDIPSTKSANVLPRSLFAATVPLGGGTSSLGVVDFPHMLGVPPHNSATTSLYPAAAGPRYGGAESFHQTLPSAMDARGRHPNFGGEVLAQQHHPSSSSMMASVGMASTGSDYDELFAVTHPAGGRTTEVDLLLAASEEMGPLPTPAQHKK